MKTVLRQNGSDLAVEVNLSIKCSACHGPDQQAIRHASIAGFGKGIHFSFSDGQVGWAGVYRGMAGTQYSLCARTMWRKLPACDESWMESWI